MRPSWLSRLFARDTQPARETGPRLIRMGRTLAGVYVDADTALKNATVWACRQYLARTVAQLPWRVGREGPDGGFNVVAGNRVDYLLHKRPNPEMGAFVFKQTLMNWALMKGNGYAEIEFDLSGQPAALWPINPDRGGPIREDGKLIYRFWNPDGSSTDLDPLDVFHVRGPGEGVAGVSIIEYAAQSIGWAQATEVFGSTFFGEGMNPTGFIKSPKPMNKAAADVLRGEADQLYKGPRGKRTMLLDDGMDFVKVGYTPEDGQFVETRQHQVEEICRWFGVPPHKVMHLLRATFSNIEHQSIEVVVDSITPWVKVFEEEADYKLFSARANLVTKMNMKGLLRGDQAARSAYFKARWENGSMSINDILRAEDENPIGPDGDVRFVPLNFQPLKRALAEPKPAPAPAIAAGDGEDPADPPPAAPKTNGRAVAH